MKAVVVGSMNCMPTAYAIFLKKYCTEVVHYYESRERDTLSNPKKSWGERSGELTKGICLRKNYFYHPLFYLNPKIFHREIISQLNNADIILLSGSNISLARLVNRSGRKIIALSYGNDVALYCNPAWPDIASAKGSGLKKIISPILRLLHSRFVKAQIAGLRSCTHYSYFIEGFDPQTDSLLENLMAGSNAIRLPRYSMNFDLVAQCAGVDPLSLLKHKYKILFPVCLGDRDRLYGDKGWRLLFDGLKKYRLVSGKEFSCICFKKGAYGTAQTYARELGIDDLIEWHEVVDFDTLIQYYISADVVIDQLGSHMIGQGMFVMALGKPLIANISIEQQLEYFHGSGVLNAYDVDSLVSHLVMCESERLRTMIGEKSRKFIREKASMDVEFKNWDILC